MDLKAKIAEAWSLTQRYPTLKWFGMIPSLLGTVVGLGWLGYQALTLGPVLLDFELDYATSLRMLIAFVQTNGSWPYWMLAVAGMVIVAYLLLPPLFQAGMIGLFQEIKQEKPINFLKGVSLGLFSYLRMFEFHAMLSPFSVITVLSIASLVLRAYHWEGFIFFLPFLLVILVISLIVGFLLSYSDFLLVLKKREVFKSITHSAALVVLHLQETVFMMVLMLLIVLRILINIVLIVFAPALIIFGLTYFSSFALGTVAITLFVLLTLFVIFLVSYLSAVIAVFTTAVWYLTFDEIYTQSGDQL